VLCRDGTDVERGQLRTLIASARRKFADRSLDQLTQEATKAATFVGAAYHDATSPEKERKGFAFKFPDDIKNDPQTGQVLDDDPVEAVLR
jgi:hypothetical protein